MRADTTAAAHAAAGQCVGAGSADGCRARDPVGSRSWRVGFANSRDLVAASDFSRTVRGAQ